MATSRRTFMKTGALVALASGVPLIANGNSLTSGKTLLSFSGIIPNTDLNMNTFMGLQGTNFLVSNNSGKNTIKLVAVRDIRKGREKASKKECFSLLFAAPVKTALRQDTYDVKHSSLGTFRMLLVPVGGNNYEAVFNRLY